MIGKLIILLAINAGVAIGWILGEPGGIMGRYFAAVLGAVLGLIIGRCGQSWLDGEE